MISFSTQTTRNCMLLTCILFLALSCSQPSGTRLGGNGSNATASEDAAMEILDEAMNILNAEKANDPVSIAEMLSLDNHVVINRLALRKLDSFRMPGEYSSECLLAERDGDTKRFREVKAKVLKWPLNYRPVREKSKENARTFDAINVLSELWIRRIRFHEVDQHEVFEYAEALIAYSEFAKNPRDEVYVIHMFLVIFDCGELDGLVRFEKGRLVSETNALEDLPKALEWAKANLKYCYFHPEERTLKLDTTARNAGVVSEEYRKKNPWKENEGPNLTNPKKIPVK